MLGERAVSAGELTTEETGLGLIRGVTDPVLGCCGGAGWDLI